jgi:hypothetical protein
MNEVATGSFSQLISNTGFAIEIVGVIIIVIGFALATLRMLRNFSQVTGEERYLTYRRGLARTMMLVFTLHLEIEGRWPWQPATVNKS